MANGDDTIRGPRALPLAIGLGAAAPVAYFLIWNVMPGGGCGPPGNTSSADILGAVPFALPVLAVVTVLTVGRMLKWRLWVLLTALLTTFAIAVTGEVFVLLLQFGAHHCGE